MRPERLGYAVVKYVERRPWYLNDEYLKEVDSGFKALRNKNQTSENINRTLQAFYRILESKHKLFLIYVIKAILQMTEKNREILSRDNLH